jgi:hypothetical protein
MRSSRRAAPASLVFPNSSSRVAIRYDRFTSILLKKSEIKVPRKSHFRAESVVSTGACHSKA